MLIKTKIMEPIDKLNYKNISSIINKINEENIIFSDRVKK